MNTSLIITALLSAWLSAILLAGCAYRGQLQTINADNVTITIDQRIDGGAVVTPSLEASVPQDTVKAAILDAAVPGASKAPAISPDAAKGILDAIKAKTESVKVVTP